MKNFNLYFLSTLIICTVLTSCFKDLKIEEPEYEYYSDLSQSNWVITRFDNTLTNTSTFPMDTIHFLDDRTYRINQESIREYLYGIDLRFNFEGHTPIPTLRLSNCLTFGGTYSANVDQVNIPDGKLNNLLFNENGENQIIVWLEKVD